MGGGRAVARGAGRGLGGGRGLAGEGAGRWLGRGQDGDLGGARWCWVVQRSVVVLAVRAWMRLVLQFLQRTWPSRG